MLLGRDRGGIGKARKTLGASRFLGIGGIFAISALRGICEPYEPSR
jgi:hypothetical protein